MKKFLIKSFIFIFSIIYILVWDIAPLLAQPDITPPTLISFDFNPKIIDVSKGVQAVEVTAVATDDLAGTSPVSFEFRNLDGVGVVGARLSVFSTTGNQSTLKGTVIFDPISRFVTPGTYLVDVMNVADRLNNVAFFRTQDIINLGFPVELFNGNTPKGNNITVNFDGISVTYLKIVNGGQTVFSSSTSGGTASIWI